MSGTTNAGPRRLGAILGPPAAIFILTVAGLAAALLGDGWWHWLSWLLLATPLAIVAAALARKKAG